MISTELSVAIIVLFNLLWSCWVCWEVEGLKLQEKGHSSHIFCPNESIKFVCTANWYRLEKLCACYQNQMLEAQSMPAVTQPCCWCFPGRLDALFYLILM